MFGVLVNCIRLWRFINHDILLDVPCIPIRFQAQNFFLPQGVLYTNDNKRTTTWPETYLIFNVNNYFTHLIHNTAVKFPWFAVCLYSRIYCYWWLGWINHITRIRNSTFPNTDSHLTDISNDRMFILLGSLNAAFRWCTFRFPWTPLILSPPGFVTLKFVLPSSHRLVRDVRSGNKIT